MAGRSIQSSRPCWQPACRRGEVLALRWRDVDLDGCKLRVEQPLEQTKGGLRFKAPKTKYGRCTITLPASTVVDLRTHRLEQRKLRLTLGIGKAPDDALVFAKWDGTPRSPHATTKEWTRTMTERWVPIGCQFALSPRSAVC